jgi:2-dehydropantoate 2-reductase
VTVAPIAVLGLGGVGGMLAARTNAICVGTERTVAAIREQGLTVVHGDETTIHHLQAYERLERPVSLLVVAVKAYALEAALDRIDPDAVADGVVLPLLNGLEHVETIRERVRGSSRPARVPAVAAGSIGQVEAYSAEPGLVVQRTTGAVIAAASRDLGPARLSELLEPLRVPGIEVAVRLDEATVLWEKAARLAVLAAATVASGERLGVLRGDDDWSARIQAALAEACAVAVAEGVELDLAGQWAIIETLSDDLTTSTARDAIAGDPTELDAITGSVVRAGRRYGIPTPALALLLDDARKAGST